MFRVVGWCQLRAMASTLACRAKLCASVADGVGSSTSDPFYSHPKMFVWVGHRDRTQPQQSSFMDATRLACGSRHWSREPGGDHNVARMFGDVLPLRGAPSGRRRVVAMATVAAFLLCILLLWLMTTTTCFADDDDVSDGGACAPANAVCHCDRDCAPELCFRMFGCNLRACCPIAASPKAAARHAAP